MVTLNELLTVTDVKHFTIYFETDAAKKARLEVPASDDDGMATISKLWGDWPVKKLSAAFRGDERMVVVIAQPEQKAEEGGQRIDDRKWTIGERIKYSRKRMGISAEELAALIGLSPSTMYRYENGDISKIDAEVLNRIAEELETTSAFLLGRGQTAEGTTDGIA